MSRLSRTGVALLRNFLKFVLAFTRNANLSLNIVMIKTFRRMLPLLAGIVILSVTARSQETLLAVDSAVVIGHLPNGLTYYIRHNEYPKGQADFYIAQKVGSILEEDNQRGLAHFLEHMCFNGTVNFPGNELVGWCESVGIRFGVNLNAYTSVDETVYNISNVPVAREGVQDTCLLILHDWADGLLLDPEEIDKERGVIHQEWRLTNVGEKRIISALLPEIYPDSRYACRLPIGTMEVVDNFSPDELRDYYNSWYRPDQQAILVVGDIDVGRMEKKIRELFSPIEMPSDAKERVYYPVEDNPGTIFAVGKDKELGQGLVEMFFKREAVPRQMKSTTAYLAVDYMDEMLQMMFASRLNEIRSKSDSPFAVARVSSGNFFISKTKDALTLLGVAKDNDLRPVLESLYRELQRALRGGFTQSEYERARSEYLSALEKSYNNRDSRESGKFIREYLDNFIDGEPIPGIEFEYSFISALAPKITLEDVNRRLASLVSGDNRVVLAMVPDDGNFLFPTSAELAEVLEKVDAEEIDTYVDSFRSGPLVREQPAAGSILEETRDEVWDATVWTLSNGARVIVKPTKFKADEILMGAVAKNGTALIGDEFADDVIFMPYALSSFGLGDFTNDDLMKYTAGRQAGISIGFKSYVRQVSGSSTPRDLPTMMELLYMAFTDLNFSEEEFAALQNTYVGLCLNWESDPQYVFTERMNRTLMKSPKDMGLSVGAIQNADRGRILGFAREMLSNAADYDFCFVGNVDVDSLRPLVERYIASLPADPATARRSVTLDPGIGLIGGTGTDESSFKMSTPQTWAAILEFGDIEYTAKNQRLASIAGQILSKRLIDIVREREGAVYSISASCVVDRLHNDPLVLQSVFPMKPEMKDRVLEIIAGEIKGMESDVTLEELNTVKEYLVKSFNESLEKNRDWLSAITGYMINGVDTFNPSLDIIQDIGVDDVRRFMKELNDQGNYRVVILSPEEGEP